MWLRPSQQRPRPLLVISTAGAAAPAHFPGSELQLSGQYLVTGKNSSINVEWSTLKLNPFEHPIWIEQARQEVNAGLLLLKKAEFHCPKHLLPILSILHNHQRQLRLLDFGGGLGQALPYIYLTTNRYSVLDGPQNCKMGRQLFNSFKNIEFFDTLPKIGSNYDIVLFNGALHYIEDWRSALKAVTAYTPQWICISRIAVGSPISVFGKQMINIGFPPQHIGEIYRWVFDLEELITMLADLSYQLVGRHPIQKTTAQGISDKRVPKTLELYTLVFEHRNPD